MFVSCAMLALDIDNFEFHFVSKVFVLWTTQHTQVYTMVYIAPTM